MNISVDYNKLKSAASGIKSNLEKVIKTNMLKNEEMLHRVPQVWHDSDLINNVKTVDKITKDKVSFFKECSGYIEILNKAYVFYKEALDKNLK